MFGLPMSETLFYGGITLLSIATALAIICTIALRAEGKKIKQKLIQEYGKQERV